MDYTSYSKPGVGNISDISKNYENVDKMIGDYSKDSSRLIGLFESAIDESNQAYVFNTGLFEKIFKQIEKLDEGNKLDESQTNKIMVLCRKIYPSLENEPLKTENIDFRLKHMDMSNVIGLLNDVKKTNTPFQVKQCLDYIAQETGAEIVVNDDSSLSIEIGNSKPPFDKLTNLNTDLSQIFDQKIAITLIPPENADILDIEKFIEVHGQFISSLDLREIGSQIDDNSIKKIIKSCPNLNQLFIKSYKIEGKGLEELSSLKRLTALNLSGGNYLETLPDAWPPGLTELHLSGCNYLETLPDAWPLGLIKLDLSGCGSLTAIPGAWPAKLTELHLSVCNFLKALPDTWPLGLIKLDLSGCGSLTAIPGAWPAKLTELNLSWCNSLKVVPNAWPAKLTKLDLSGCGSLTAIPGAWPAKLTELNLSACNSLKVVPNAWPAKLTALNLSKCGLETLPDSWPAGLTELNLSGNLEALPGAWPAKLTELNLSWCNNLKAVPDAWPPGLTKLDLSGCDSLTALPGAWPADLRELNLSNCGRISDDFRLASFSSLIDKNFDQGLKLLFGFDIKDRAKLQELLVLKLEKKLIDQTTNPEELLVVANFIYIILGLHEEHPLMQEAISIITANQQPELKNPFSLFKKLKDLSLEPTHFQPLKMSLGGVNVKINIDKLKSMSKALKIKREDLPKNVNIESFDKLFNDLKSKVENDSQNSSQALEKLGTTWAAIQMPISGDPSKYLIGLLDLSGENVSETEAKWRAVLCNILEKDQTSKENTFFTEQEEVFILTMMGIQNCQGGKGAGIASTYEQLESKYRYPVELSKAMTVDEMEAEEKKNTAVKFLKEFVGDQSKETSLEVMAENLVALVNKDLKANSKIIYSLIADESFWDMDKETFDMKLNKAGALELISIARKAEIVNLLSPFIGQTIQKLMESQFSGTNILMQELTGTKEIEQGSHQSIYLRNLIGQFAGVSQAVVFDRNTGVLYDNLVKKERDEVLAAFFRHVTPEVLVNEVVRAMNEAPTEMKDTLKSILSEDKYWDNKKAGTLSKAGTLELLHTLEYVKKD